MSKGRTLVVSHDYLDELRQGLVDMAMFFPPAGRIYKSQIAILDKIAACGTTVDLPVHQVLAAADRLVAGWVTTQPATERERFYSEAQAADADWTPSGSTA